MSNTGIQRPRRSTCGRQTNLYSKKAKPDDRKTRTRRRIAVRSDPLGNQKLQPHLRASSPKVVGLLERRGEGRGSLSKWNHRVSQWYRDSAFRSAPKASRASYLHSTDFAAT